MEAKKQTEKILNNLAKTEQFAGECLEWLRNKKNGLATKATLVALEGDLGSGKTTFTQAAARALGISDRVTSPTFVIMKNYTTPKKNQGQPLVGVWENLIHIDCYRLNGSEDLHRLGWEEMAANKNNLILVEWPERVGDLISFPTLKIKFEVIGETSRKIIYD